MKGDEFLIFSWHQYYFTDIVNMVLPGDFIVDCYAQQ